MIKLKSVVAGLSLVGLVAVTGCTSTTAGRSSATAYQRDNDVMDIHPLESTTPAYQAAAYQPVQQPVTYDAPAPVTATAAMPVASAVAISSTPTASAGIGTHVVRKGETMYSIARESYGNGKQWKKIAMANPGVSPNSLKVGQSLIIP